ncbi:MAG: hypothetical protein FGM22_08275 [Burkholderiaceae bacterium]|nr:hypothetical protein [Burkholderiaceae bacterium]
MTSSAVSAFAAQAAASRAEVFATDCQYGEETFQGVASTERDARALRDGGFAMAADRTLRVLKSALRATPRPETAISVGGKKYRISEVKNVLHSGEWLLSLLLPG